MRMILRHAGRTAAAVALGVTLALGIAAETIAGPHILVDLTTGKVIEHDQAFQRWYPASLTKLMVAYTTFDLLRAGKITLSMPVVMSKASAGEPASKMYLKPGDSMSLDDALKVMLTKSANDIAYAIAENVGGNMPTFVNMMNANAARLGLFSTHFINPNGLPGDGQYTSARDLAVLVMALRHQFPQYAGYFSLEGIKVGKRQYGNYNKLIGRFAGADGMKTGFICASGYNQISTATRNGHTMLSIVLGADTLLARSDVSAALLEKGMATEETWKMPQLVKLAPYGATRDVVADVSQEVCKKRGKKVRSEASDEADTKTVSPFSLPIDHPLNVALITIVPAGKPLAVADDPGQGDTGDQTKNIPIPEPRPVN